MQNFASYGNMIFLKFSKTKKYNFVLANAIFANFLSTNLSIINKNLNFNYYVLSLIPCGALEGGYTNRFPIPVLSHLAPFMVNQQQCLFNLGALGRKIQSFIPPPPIYRWKEMAKNEVKICT